MVRFPETAWSEWEIIAKAAEATDELRQRIARDTLVEAELERLRVRHEAKNLLQQEIEADSTPTLTMLTLADYKSTPSLAPFDLIEGVMKEDGLCLVLGPSRSGKSTLALQMLHSLMTGCDWLGQPVQKIDGAVGIVSYDMDGAMVLNWMSGFPGVDPAKVSVVSAYKQGNPLAVAKFRKQIADTWKRMGVEVVVIDSFSASFFGVDQNDAAATMAHYRDLKKFALMECGAKAVIVIAHSTDGSPKKPRGSSVHIDTADTIVVVWPDSTTGQRMVDIEKYREAIGTGQTQMPPVIVSAPDSVTHLVSLDPGAMTLAGLALPPSLVAQAFTELPDTIEEPETVDSDEEDEEDMDL